MAHDPAWDMPLENWQPQGSFTSPIPIPALGPTEGTLICVPSFNQEWLRIILGCLDQLRIPATWDAPDDAAMSEVLSWVDQLKQCFSMAGPCSSAPYVPPGTSTDQAACNIAGYLSNQVIRYAMNNAIQGVKNTLNELQFLLWIVRLITGIFPITSFVVSAFVQLYSQILSGTLTDYQDAVADDALWAEVACAIYNCIKTDGNVTPANFPCIHTALCALTYTPSSVTTAICDFVGNAGSQAFLQAQQPGIIATYTCSCSGGPPVSSGPGLPPGDRAAGIVQVLISAGNAIGQALVTFDRAFPTTPVISPGTDDPIMIPSIASAGPTTFLATVEAARPVDVDTTVDVDWIALMPGQV